MKVNYVKQRASAELTNPGLTEEADRCDVTICRQLGTQRFLTRHLVLSTGDKNICLGLEVAIDLLMEFSTPKVPFSAL